MTLEELALWAGIVAVPIGIVGVWYARRGPVAPKPQALVNCNLLGRNDKWIAYQCHVVMIPPFEETHEPKGVLVASPPVTRIRARQRGPISLEDLLEQEQID